MADLYNRRKVREGVRSTIAHLRHFCVVFLVSLLAFSLVVYNLPRTGAWFVSHGLSAQMSLQAGETPYVTDVVVRGVPHVGETLTGDYQYSHPNKISQDHTRTTYAWYRVTAAERVRVGSSLSYTLQEADGGHYVMFEVTPAATYGFIYGPSGLASSSAPVNRAPVAKAVVLTQAGEQLNGTFSYYDADNDAPGSHVYKWYRRSSGGLSYISGVTADTYTITPDDHGTDIYFEVTPVAVTGKSPGTPVISNSVYIPVPPPPPPGPLMGTISPNPLSPSTDPNAVINLGNVPSPANKLDNIVIRFGEQSIRPVRFTKQPTFIIECLRDSLIAMLRSDGQADSVQRMIIIEWTKDSGSNAVVMQGFVSVSIAPPAPTAVAPPTSQQQGETSGPGNTNSAVDTSNPGQSTEPPVTDSTTGESTTDPTSEEPATPTTEDEDPASEEPASPSPGEPTPPPTEDTGEHTPPPTEEAAPPEEQNPEQEGQAGDQSSPDSTDEGSSSSGEDGTNEPPPPPPASGNE